MEQIKIHILHTGEVCVSPYLPFGGNNCNIIKASGITTKKETRLWLPVSCYFIEHPKGNILVDCGWHRDMSPNGVFDKKAQIKSLGSHLLYAVNQGKIEKGAAIDEQLAAMGIQPADLDYVLLTHLDCDHANGMALVKDAKQILVSNEELICVQKKHPIIQIRFQQKWWQECHLKGFDWNTMDGPFCRAFDLFGDSSIKLIHIPGHSDGQCAVKITNEDGKYVLLFADGGYADKSWLEMIPSGIAMDKNAQHKSLKWIREQSMNENCIASIASHDADVVPHIIVL